MGEATLQHVMLLHRLWAGAVRFAGSAFVPGSLGRMAAPWSASTGRKRGLAPQPRWLQARRQIPVSFCVIQPSRGKSEPRAFQFPRFAKSIAKRHLSASVFRSFLSILPLRHLRHRLHGPLPRSSQVKSKQPSLSCKCSSSPSTTLC